MKKTAWSVLLFALLTLYPHVPAFADDMSMASLKEINAKQDRILQALEEIKSELNIVKIRASNKA